METKEKVNNKVGIVVVPKDFFEHLLNCLFNQIQADQLKELNILTERKIESNKREANDAWSDGMCINDNRRFVPKSKILQKYNSFKGDGSIQEPVRRSNSRDHQDLIYFDDAKKECFDKSGNGKNKN